MALCQNIKRACNENERGHQNEIDRKKYILSSYGVCAQAHTKMTRYWKTYNRMHSLSSQSPFAQTKHILPHALSLYDNLKNTLMNTINQV